MQEASAQAAQQLASIDAKKLAKAAQLVRQANEELAHNQLAAAQMTISELTAQWPEYEGLSRLQQRLASSQSANEVSSQAEAGGLKADKAAAAAKP